MRSGGEGSGQRVPKPGGRPCDEAPWTEGVLELLNDLVETSVEVKEEFLEDQHLLRPCLDCLASPSEAAVESAMELLVTLSEDGGLICRALDAGEWVRQVAGAGTKAPLLQQLPSWDSCGKERGNCWCINTYATVEALSCWQKLSKRS